MTRKTVFLLAGLLISCSIAQAQTATPESPPAPSAPAAGGAAPRSLTPAQQANHDRIKGERETCRKQARDQGLKGPAIQAAVQECMTKVDPVVGKRMGCFKAGKDKNLSGDELRKSVKECMQST